MMRGRVKGKMFGAAIAMMLAAAVLLVGGGSSAGAAETSVALPTATPSPAPNVMNAYVWGGPYGTYFNGPFTHVTICQSGTANCETIHGVLIDTGSAGLRIFGALNHLPLPTVLAPDGSAVAECMPFGTLTTWGRVAYADVKLGGEPIISKMPIQLINPNYSSIPAACNGGPPLAQNPSQLGYNGILGVGLWGPDCGDVCTAPGPQNPLLYYRCAGGGCRATSLANAEQVQNPVALLPADNNGVVLRMPGIPSTGAPSVMGHLLLGINTRHNNRLHGAFVYKTDGAGNIATTFNNATMDGFLDSGSNALFFDAGAIPQCDPSLAAGFYCPPGALVLGAINSGRDGTASGEVFFDVANALSLAATGNKAFSNVAGTFGGSFFDFGLPFFFGRDVFTGIDGQATAGAGTGPFFAY
jgi:uncharacterized protein DUF3443